MNILRLPYDLCNARKEDLRTEISAWNIAVTVNIDRYMSVHGCNLFIFDLVDSSIAFSMTPQMPLLLNVGFVNTTTVVYNYENKCFLMKRN